MVQTVMYQIQFLNKCLNNKKYPSLDGNFYKILHRTILVKSYVPQFRKPVNSKI